MSSDNGGSARSIAAKAALATSAATIAWESMPTHWNGGHVAWELLGVSAALLAAAPFLGGRRLLPNVFARGLAWAVAVPAALGSLISTVEHRPNASLTLVAVSTLAALGLATRSLRSPEARRAFAPVASRGWFLASSVAAVCLGAITSLVAVEITRFGGFPPVAIFGLAAGLVGSAVGVLRMRGWGVLLGVLTAAVAAVCGVVDGSLAYLTLAIPGLMMLAPVVRAKLGLGPDQVEAATRARVSLDAMDAPRVRVAIDAEEDTPTLEAGDLAEAPHARLAAPAPPLAS